MQGHITLFSGYSNFKSFVFITLPALVLVYCAAVIAVLCIDQRSEKEVIQREERSMKEKLLRFVKDVATHSWSSKVDSFCFEVLSMPRMQKYSIRRNSLPLFILGSIVMIAILLSPTVYNADCVDPLISE